MSRRKSLIMGVVGSMVSNATYAIYYTSSNGNIVTPYSTNAFGANIISNNYIDGQGIISFDGPVTTIGDSAFSYCDSLTSITIPDSVTSIGILAFRSCTSLTSITIPDSVTTIVERAFAYCDSLKEFKGKFASDNGRCLIVDGVLNSFANGCGATEYTIPNGITTIGYYAFANCDSLTSVIIGKGVTKIGERAFYSCDSLTSVTIPNSVTTIGNYAFNDCTKLKSVYCKATTPPRLGGTYVFDNNLSTRKIYVPRNSVSAYKSASRWSEYASYITGYNF